MIRFFSCVGFAVIVASAPRILVLGQASASSFVVALPQPNWGRIVQPTNGTGVIQLEMRVWPVDGNLALPTPFPNITAAHLVEGSQRLPLKWVFNADATQLYLEMSAQPPTKGPALILLETAEKT